MTRAPSRTGHSGLIRQLIAACALCAAVLNAQTPRADSTNRAKPLFTLSDAAIGVGFSALTFAAYPADRSIALRMQAYRKSSGKSIDQLATGFENLATPGALLLGAGAYAYGRLAHEENIADVGLHVSEAFIVGGIATSLIKGLAGRSRPYVSADTNPHDWKFGGGINSADRQSFPSGHTTVAFAAAAALTSEVQRLWPKYTWPAGIALYGSATIVGLARMYHNKHWASDVALGAGIGTLAGLKTVQYSHQHKDNYVDRLLLQTSIVPNARGGGSVGWSVAFR